MAEVPFDTLAVARRLEAGSFDAGQAEAVTETVRAGVTRSAAAGNDLSRLETRITTELRWIKLIGAAILAVLILPWLAEPISGTVPGP